MMKKHLLLLVLFAVCGFTPAAHGQVKRIAVAYSAVSATQSSFFVTKEGGYFEKHGLFVDPVYVASGTKVAQAVIAGEFPVALAGGDIVIIGGLVNVPSFYVYVHPSIKRPEDFKGKSIGITTYGSSTDFSIRYLIKKWGMESDRDIKVLQMGGQPQIVAAMVGGSVQGGVLSSPTDFKAKKAGFHQLVDFKTVGLDYPTVSLISTRSFIKKDPQTVRRFLMAYSEGVERLYRDKEFTMKVIGKYTKTDDRETLESAFGFATTFIERPPHLPYKAVETILAQIAEKDPKVKDHKADEFIDPTFYNEMEKSGFFKSIAR